MKFNIQNILFGTCALLAGALPFAASAQVQFVQSGQGLVTSGQAPSRMDGPRSRSPNNPRMEEGGAQRQGSQDVYRPRSDRGNYRGDNNDPGRTERSDGRNESQPARYSRGEGDRDYGRDQRNYDRDHKGYSDRDGERHDGYRGGGRNRYDGYRNGYRDGYDNGHARGGWAHSRYDGPARYNGYGRGGYGRGTAFGLGYAPRNFGYRGWGWPQGGYASPIVIAPVGYRGWARNYPFSAPIVVVPAYGGWALGPRYPVRRR